MNRRESLQKASLATIGVITVGPTTSAASRPRVQWTREGEPRSFKR